MRLHLECEVPHRKHPNESPTAKMDASHCGNTVVGILGEVGKEHGDDKEHEDDVDGELTGDRGDGDGGVVVNGGTLWEHPIS